TVGSGTGGPGAGTQEPSDCARQRDVFWVDKTVAEVDGRAQQGQARKTTARLTGEPAPKGTDGPKARSPEQTTHSVQAEEGIDAERMNQSCNQEVGTGSIILCVCGAEGGDFRVIAAGSEV